MVEPEDLSYLGRNSSKYVHLLAEVMKRAFADRAHYLGDADFSPVPFRGLISKEYAHKRRADIHPDRTTLASDLGPGDPLPFESEDTTHFSVVDREGNAVANTYTLNGGYGSGLTVPGAGFLIKQRNGRFLFQARRTEPVRSHPGRGQLHRPKKTSPIGHDPDDRPQGRQGAVGNRNPGRPRDHQYGFPNCPQCHRSQTECAAGGRLTSLHHQWLPDVLRYEEHGLVRDVEEALRAKGHALAPRTSIGDAHSIYVDPETEIRLGAADPRMDGKAVGY